MKKLKCKICECEFVSEKKEHYVARTDGKTGVVSMFQSNDETGLFDAFDCPQCGCQVIAQERKRSFYNIKEQDAAEDNEWGTMEERLATMSDGETEETIPAKPHKKRVPESEDKE